MSFDPKNYEITVASSVSDRDGIGVEIYRDSSMVCEIFRDDTKRTREIWTSKQEVSLEEMEGFIKIFKEEIPWDFIEYEE
ncbi:hypothetical protein [Pelagicoccus sp. SDUM812002]|uniref:hypothetical protein n=1 Tax=Pelagicoccus sp. SDUM812002 TaxID=3041266 RepID=UPI00280E7824|nr:hypothetical protein [Pelagicoccus sp. SDUM812002]MDQ8188613.1 hypothetical protein [Pelagicoccus sp. SDUM812002]